MGAPTKRKHPDTSSSIAALLHTSNEEPPVDTQADRADYNQGNVLSVPCAAPNHPQSSLLAPIMPQGQTNVQRLPPISILDFTPTLSHSDRVNQHLTMQNRYIYKGCEPNRVPLAHCSARPYVQQHPLPAYTFDKNNRNTLILHPKSHIIDSENRPTVGSRNEVDPIRTLHHPSSDLMKVEQRLQHNPLRSDSYGAATEIILETFPSNSRHQAPYHDLRRDSIDNQYTTNIPTRLPFAVGSAPMPVLPNGESATDNLITITISTPAAAQKSYGFEKRFLCPPPIVRMIGKQS